MTDASYQLVFNGEIAAGHEAANVKRTVGKMFGLGSDEVDVLFSGKRAVLKRGLEQTASQEYRAKLEQIGLVVTVEQEAGAAAPPAAAPQAADIPAPAEPAQPAQPDGASAEARGSGDDGANFYAPPAAALGVEATISSELVEPRKLQAGRGWGWIADAFKLFAKDWLMWIVAGIIYIVIVMVLSIIPFVSIVVSILFPILVGGFMIGARESDQGGNFRIDHVFAGFKENTGSLAAIGALYLAGTIVLGLIVALVVGGVALSAGVFETLAEAEGDPGALMAGGLTFVIVLIVLIVLALTLPLVMALWFSPALAAINGMGAVEAMKLSFVGCLRNIVPFLIYGLIAIAMSLVALATLGLGYLVLGPVFLASMYVGYREIFLAD